eukprot:g15187.t1
MHLEIALLVKHEWEAQKEEIAADSMPFHTLVCTGIDQAYERSLDLRTTNSNRNTPRGEEVERILKYLETDTICYTIPLQKEQEAADSTLHSGASDLLKLQKRMAEQWAPVVSGFGSYHKVEIVTNDYHQILLENEQKLQPKDELEVVCCSRLSKAAAFAV